MDSASGIKEIRVALTGVEVPTIRPLPVMPKDSVVVDKVDETLLKTELSTTTMVEMTVAVLAATSVVALDSTGREIVVEEKARLMK